MSAFLVDTNVLVYAYDPADSGKHERAVDVLRRLGQSHLGVLSTQVLSEFFVTAIRKIPQPLTAAEAERSATNYARSWVVYDVTSSAVLEAMRGMLRHGFSYWDGLIWATAKNNGVPFVLSEDFSHNRMTEGVRFLNPFEPNFDMTLLEASSSSPPSR